MNPFWTNAPLDSNQRELIEVIFEAHRKSVFRDNISSAVLKATFEGSWSYQQALACAILSFGGTHGPVESVMDIIMTENPDVVARMNIQMGHKVPGWGISFKDSIWEDVGARIRTNWPDTIKKVDMVTEVLHSAGKTVYPNPACWTACCNVIVGVPRHLALWPVVQGRLPGWTQLLL